MTTKNTILKDIRTFCIDCMGGQPSLVTDCESGGCPLHNYRMGKDMQPNAAKSEAAKRPTTTMTRLSFRLTTVRV